ESCSELNLVHKCLKLKVSKQQESRKTRTGHVIGSEAIACLEMSHTHKHIKHFLIFSLSLSLSLTLFWYLCHVSCPLCAIFCAKHQPLGTSNLACKTCILPPICFVKGRFSDRRIHHHQSSLRKTNKK